MDPAQIWGPLSLWPDVLLRHMPQRLWNCDLGVRWGAMSPNAGSHRSRPAGVNPPQFFDSREDSHESGSSPQVQVQVQIRGCVLAPARARALGVQLGPQLLHLAAQLL